MDFFSKLLSNDFMPHGHCFLWNRELVTMHVVSDALITLAYYSIPIALLYFVRRRRDIAFDWMFWMFGAFIFACGTTHLMNIWTIWIPTYRLDAAIKIVTAVLSVATAVILWPLIPRAVALPSPRDLEATNMQLRREVMERQLAEQRVRRMNSDLERRVEERTAALTRSNESLRQFAYVASHDLQEPLRTVASCTELLSRRYAGRLDADADQVITYAVEGAKRMHELLNALLAYARVDRASMGAHPIDSERALHDVLEDLRIVVDETDAVVTGSGLPTVMAEASQIRQLFQNLIGNAIKFRGPRPPRIHVAAERADEVWRFSVADNGIGLSPDHADRIFEMFQRLHDRGQYPGTGIGLAICKRIVEGHGGRIWVESQPGRGCTFFFTLPAERAQAA